MHLFRVFQSAIALQMSCPISALPLKTIKSFSKSTFSKNFFYASVLIFLFLSPVLRFPFSALFRHDRYHAYQNNIMHLPNLMLDTQRNSNKLK